MTLDCGQHTEPTKRTSVFETGHPATKMQGVNRQMCLSAELTKTQTAPGSVLPEERWMETTTRCPLSWKGLMLHIKQSKEIGNLIVSHSLTPPNISEFDSLSLCQSKTRYNPIFLTLDLASSLMSLRCPNFWQCCFKLFWLNLISWMLIIRLVSSSTIKRKSPATQMADLKTTSHFMKEFFFFLVWCFLCSELEPLSAYFGEENTAGQPMSSVTLWTSLRDNRQKRWSALAAHRITS